MTLTAKGSTGGAEGSAALGLQISAPALFSVFSGVAQQGERRSIHFSSCELVRNAERYRKRIDRRCRRCYFLNGVEGI